MRRLAILTGLVIGTTVSLHAGNPDRVGEAGAYELVMVPWARTAGLNYIASSWIQGIEAIRLNVGGLAFVPGTEFALTRTIFYAPDVLNATTLGIGQKLNDQSALGIEIFTLTAGEIPITTELQPEGTGGVYKPQFINVALAYARHFSDFIHAGIVVRTIYEGIHDVNASGVAFDAGVQYTAERLHFGVSLRNIGFPIKYKGSGMSRLVLDPTGSYQMTMQIPSEDFELPLLLHIGAAYDILKDDGCKRASLMFNFTSNAFGDDLIGLGGEFAYKELAMFRIGYTFEKEMFAPQRGDTYTRLHLRSGLSLGLSLQLPLRKPDGEEGVPAVALDYAFRPAAPLGNIHSIGVRFTIGAKMPKCVSAGETASGE